MQLRANRLALGQPKQIALALGLALGITLSGVMERPKSLPNPLRVDQNRHRDRELSGL